jgi:hypothetical protein
MQRTRVAALINADVSNFAFDSSRGITIVTIVCELYRIPHLIDQDPRARRRSIMAAMVWITVGGVAVLMIVGILVAAVRKRGGSGDGDRDRGIISTSWLNEHRASDRDSDHNR